MLARIKFDYCHDKIEALNATDKERLQKVLSTDEDGYYAFSGPRLVELDEFIPLAIELNLPYVIQELKGCVKEIGFVEKTKEIINIAIPNVGLLAINKVKVEEDYCTDALQGDLNNGWRIVAVCPPNSVRRPSYILGRAE